MRRNAPVPFGKGTTEKGCFGSTSLVPYFIRKEGHRNLPHMGEGDVIPPYPLEIISHAVWLYFRFSLSFRDVEELLAQRGIVVTYETVRQWCLKFGQTYANELRRRRPRCGDTWHLDEVVLTIRGKKHYLWRAVDQHGNILDILVQSRRNKKGCVAKTLKDQMSEEALFSC